MTDAKFMCECLRSMGLGTGNAAADLIEQQAARIAALEAALTVPDYAMPPDGQEWAKVIPGVAFHLIERHAENWAHAGQLMEAWRVANTAPVSTGPRYDWTVSGMKQSETGNWVMAGEASGTDSAMAKDADRYRWLRERYTGFDFDWMPDEDGKNGKQVICFEMTPGMRIGRDIDAAIDDALTPPTPPTLEPEPERDTRTIDMFASQAS